MCECLLVCLSSTFSFLAILLGVLRTQNVLIFTYHTYISQPKCIHLSRAPFAAELLIISISDSPILLLFQSHPVHDSLASSIVLTLNASVEGGD